MNNSKVNIAFIVQISEDNWRNFEKEIKSKVDRLIFVKKCPTTVKLEVKENFPIRKGENERFNNGPSCTC